MKLKSVRFKKTTTVPLVGTVQEAAMDGQITVGAGGKILGISIDGPWVVIKTTQGKVLVWGADLAPSELAADPAPPEEAKDGDVPGDPPADTRRPGRAARS